MSAARAWEDIAICPYCECMLTGDWDLRQHLQSRHPIAEGAPYVNNLAETDAAMSEAIAQRAIASERYRLAFSLARFVQDLCRYRLGMPLATAVVVGDVGWQLGLNSSVVDVAVTTTSFEGKPANCSDTNKLDGSRETAECKTEEARVSEEDGSAAIVHKLAQLLSAQLHLHNVKIAHYRKPEREEAQQAHGVDDRNANKEALPPVKLDPFPTDPDCRKFICCQQHGQVRSASGDVVVEVAAPVGAPLQQLVNQCSACSCAERRQGVVDFTFTRDNEEHVLDLLGRGMLYEGISIAATLSPSARLAIHQTSFAIHVDCPTDLWRMEYLKAVMRCPALSKLLHAIRLWGHKCGALEWEATAVGRCDAVYAIMIMTVYALVRCSLASVDGRGNVCGRPSAPTMSWCTAVVPPTAVLLAYVARFYSRVFVCGEEVVQLAVPCSVSVSELTPPRDFPSCWLWQHPTAGPCRALWS